MKRYYYHGLEGDFVECLNGMLLIINSGELKTRNMDMDKNDSEYDRYNHVCLYRKNEEFDYDAGLEAFCKSARAGWIDHCWFFIVSPDVSAKNVAQSSKVGFDEFGNPLTNLVDEWRSDGSIPLDKIVGIGIPFDNIEKEAKRFGCFYGSDVVYSIDEYYQLLNSLIELANSFHWIIANSDEKDVCDKLDEQLNKHNIKL